MPESRETKPEDVDSRPQRIRVCHITPSFYPATRFGGPIVSTRRLCDELAALEGVELRVETTNTSGESGNEKLRSGAFESTFEPGYRVRYHNKWAWRDISPGLIPAIASAVREADVIHLTGVYSWPTLPTLALCALFDKPLVWSPRGALQRWPGSRRRRIKELWLAACRRALSKLRFVVHVTSEDEANACRLSLPNVRTEVIANGVDVPEAAPRSWMPDGVLRILFLGRLDPTKALENLLQALALVGNPRWVLTICGTGAFDYETKLRNLAKELRIETRMRFAGHVLDERKRRILEESDLCILPSHTENFGMVVAEALSHGIPTIASHGTPWERLEARRCGRWVENTPASLARTIDEIRHENLSVLGANGREWMRAEFGWHEKARQMLTVYRRLAEAQE